MVNLLEKLRPSGCVNTTLGLTDNRIGAATMADTSHNDSVETWKDIPGWEGCYELCVETQNVRSLSRMVRSVMSKTGRRKLPQRILKPGLARGYKKFQFQSEGRSCWVYLHELICAAAHGSKPFPSACVRHLNGDPVDNRPENLAWGTYKENAADSMRHGTFPMGKRNGKTKFNQDVALEIIVRFKAGESVRSIAEGCGVHPSTAYRIATGRRWAWLSAA